MCLPQADLHEGLGNAAFAESIPEIDESCIFEGFISERIPHHPDSQRTSFGILDCGGDVTVELPFWMDKSAEDVIPRYKQGIRDAWDNAYSFIDSDGTRRAVRVAPQMSTERPENLRDGYFNRVSAARGSAEDMYNWSTTDQRRPPGAGEEWESWAPGSVNRTAAHEAGHYLLAPDVYGRSEDSFETLTGRPPESYEQQFTSDGVPYFHQRNALMGDNGADLPRTMPGLSAAISKARGDDVTLEPNEPAQGPTLGQSPRE